MLAKLGIIAASMMILTAAGNQFPVTVSDCDNLSNPDSICQAHLGDGNCTVGATKVTCEDSSTLICECNPA